MRFFIVTAALILLSACGQKGPLYLPQDAPDTGALTVSTIAGK